MFWARRTRHSRGSALLDRSQVLINGRTTFSWIESVLSVLPLGRLSLHTESCSHNIHSHICVHMRWLRVPTVDLSACSGLYRVNAKTKVKIKINLWKQFYCFQVETLAEMHSKSHLIHWWHRRAKLISEICLHGNARIMAAKSTNFVIVWRWCAACNQFTSNVCVCICLCVCDFCLWNAIKVCILPSRKDQRRKKWRAFLSHRHNAEQSE